MFPCFPTTFLFPVQARCCLLNYLSIGCIHFDGWLSSISGCEKKLHLPRQMNFIYNCVFWWFIFSLSISSGFMSTQMFSCRIKLCTVRLASTTSSMQHCSIRYGAKCIVPWNMFQLCYSSRWIITSHQTRKPCLMMFDHDVQYLENAPLVPYLCCMPNLHQQVHEAVQSTEGQCLNACLWLLLKKRILNCKSASLVIVGAFSEYLLYNPIT